MKQLTLSAAVKVEKQVVATEDAVVARVVNVSFTLDYRKMTKSAYIQIGLFNAKDELVKCLDAITIDPVPDGWVATLDTLDTKVLAEIKGRVEAGKALPDGTVGTFDAVAVAAKIAEPVKVEVIEEPIK